VSDIKRANEFNFTKIEKYCKDALSHWITVLFEGKTLNEMLLISVPPRACFPR